MTDTHYDRAPGDRPILTGLEEEASSGLLVYTIGLALAVILTATSFWVANTSLLWKPGISLGLAVLAIAQSTGKPRACTAAGRVAEGAAYERRGNPRAS